MQVKLTILSSACRCGYHKAGDTFLVSDLCAPLCQELWNCAYPMVYALQNGGMLDCGDGRGAAFTVRCPDEGRVVLHGQRVEEN